MSVCVFFNATIMILIYLVFFFFRHWTTEKYRKLINFNLSIIYRCLNCLHNNNNNNNNNNNCGAETGEVV